MIDIATQSEVFLREAGYDTWPWSGASPPVICFENAAIVGFLHQFDSAAALISGWDGAQAKALARHAPALRAAGTKAWNVYSIFLTSERVERPARRAIERLEEDFSLTRKIARSGIQLAEDLEHALMPLAPIKAKPLLQQARVEDRLRLRSKDIPEKSLEAFLGPMSADDVALVLGGNG